MKFLLTLVLAAFSLTALQSQTNETSTISADNLEYMEWVSQNGFRFISDFKSGETTINAEDVIDAEGNSIPTSVVASSFDITKYNFDEIIAPAKNILIKIDDTKAILIYSKNRQEVLFKRYLINQSANTNN